MKNTIYIIALGILVTLSACSRDEKNLFDQSAAERSEARQQMLKTNLMAAENGWEMLYFPNPDAAGYALLCKFAQDGSVTFAAKNKVSSSNIYKEEVSLWNTDATQGTVLTFTTYNTLFTVFADPGSDGVGYEGDYEFVVLDQSASHIYLKGKKHGAYIHMNRLDAAQDWEQYFRAIDKFNNDIFVGNSGIEMAYTDGDTIYQMKYNDGAFTYKDREGQDQQKGFLISPTGLHFYSGCPVAGSDALAKDFVMDADKTMLVNTENSNIFFVSNYTPAEFYAYKYEKLERWIYTEDGSDAATAAAVNEIKALAAANGAEITRIAYDCYFTVNSRTGRKVAYYSLYVAYIAEGTLFEGRIMANYTNKDGVITYTYKSLESTLDALMSRIDTDKDAAVARFSSIFFDSFTASSYTGTKLNMVQLLLSSTTDSNKYIHVIADTTK